MHKLTNKEAWGLIGSADTEEAKQCPDTQSALKKLRACTNNRRSTARITASGHVTLGHKGVAIACVTHPVGTDQYVVGIRVNYFTGAFQAKFRGPLKEVLAYLHGWLANDHNVLRLDTSKFEKWQSNAKANR